MKCSRSLATTALVAALILALAALGGCSDDSPATGTLVLQLTDAPFPYDMIASVNLGVEGIEVHLAATGDAAQSGFYQVDVNSAQAFSLLDLTNGTTAFLGGTELPVGEIKQMRLQVTSSTVKLTDGREFDLTVPSGESSGLKVFFEPPILVKGGEETSVLIDVDMTQSYSSVPASPTQVDEITEFRFHPVLRISVTGDSGTLAGRVTASADGSPIENATVSLWVNGAPVTSTATDAAGAWMMLGVEPGTKIVRAEALGYVPAQTTATSVADETTTGVNLALNTVP